MKIRSLGQLPGEVGPGDLDPDEWEEWKEAWLGNLRRCALWTRVGHHNPFDKETPTGEYEVCLTSHQARTLFGDKIARSGKARRLGCGTFACAWARTKTRAVKITADPDDVTAFIAAQDVPHVATLHQAYNLKGAGTTRGGRSMALYGLVMERLEPLDELRTEWLMEFPARTFGRNFVEHYGSGYLTPEKDLDRSYNVSPTLKDAVEDQICDATMEEDEDTCRRFVGEMVSTVERLGQHGINWMDIHEGNVGMTSDGTWKVLDLGVSGERAIPTEREAPTLRGALGSAGRGMLLGASIATLVVVGAMIVRG